MLPPTGRSQGDKEGAAPIQSIRGILKSGASSEATSPPVPTEWSAVSPPKGILKNRDRRLSEGFARSERSARPLQTRFHSADRLVSTSDSPAEPHVRRRNRKGILKERSKSSESVAKRSSIRFCEAESFCIFVDNEIVTGSTEENSDRSRAPRRRVSLQEPHFSASPDSQIDSVKGILKSNSYGVMFTSSEGTDGILRQHSSDSLDAPRGILKPPSSSESSRHSSFEDLCAETSGVHSILRANHDTQNPSVPKGIRKIPIASSDSESETPGGAHVKSILRMMSDDETCSSVAGATGPPVKGILRPAPSSSAERSIPPLVTTCPPPLNSDLSIDDNSSPTISSQPETPYSSQDVAPAHQSSHNPQVQSAGTMPNVDPSDTDNRPSTAPRSRDRPSRMSRSGGGGDHSRRLTQPVTVPEIDNAEESTANLTVSERRALLQAQNAASAPRRAPAKLLSQEIYGLPDDADDEEPPLNSRGTRTGSIRDRLSMLEENSETWKRRAPREGEKVRSELTVGGRLRAVSTILDGSGDNNQQQLLPKKTVRRGASFSKREREKAYRDQLSKEPITLRDAPTEMPDMPWLQPNSSEPAKPAQVVKEEVHIYDPNQTIGDFFASSSDAQTDAATAAASTANIDLDAIGSGGEGSSEPAMNVARRAAVRRPPRKQAAHRNPVKATESAAKSSYTEERKVLVKSNSLDDGEKNKGKFDKSALAALHTTVKYETVKLKKLEESRKQFEQRRCRPYNDLMLIMVKGKYHVQVRLVEPSARSINESDSFLLVTPDLVMVFKGKFSNIIEQNKAMELAKLIVDRSDLGTKASNFSVIESSNPDPGLERKFFKLLGSAGRMEISQFAEDVDGDDKWFEECVTATNKVYLIDQEQQQLIPLIDQSCVLPTYSMLQPNRSYVFDFGSELYAWFGTDAHVRDRFLGPHFILQLFSDGYDYTTNNSRGEDVVLCPLFPLDDDAPLKGSPRPDWAICGKVNSRMETLLFSQKFHDWPDKNFMKEVRQSANYTDEKNLESTLSALEESSPEMREMLQPNEFFSKGYVLESVNVGRGNYWKDPIERRAHNVITTSVKVWPVVDNSVMSEKANYWLFHSTETYVVRWSFYTEFTGYKRLAGAAPGRVRTGSKMPLDDKVAYFFWQGGDATQIDAGTVALTVVDMGGAEGGKQVRVEQFEEPAPFLRLFDGHLVIQRSHRGRPSAKWRLFYAQGSYPEEFRLIEVPALEEHSLNPLIPYIAFRDRGNEVYVVADKKRCPQRDLDNVQKVVEFHLNSGSDGLLSGLSAVPDKCSVLNMNSIASELPELNSLLKSSFLGISVSADTSSAKRLFVLSSVSRGSQFTFREVLCPSESLECPLQLPFRQYHLHNQIQPAFLLYDCGSRIYLWQGSLPQDSLNSEEASVGGTRRRFVEEKKCALETALGYARARRLKEENCLLVECGKESNEFRMMFAEWPATEEECSMATVADALKQFSHQTYPYSVLSGSREQLPPDVDPMRLEDYLSDSDFQELLGMPRAEFKSLPLWKKTEKKKLVDLF